jgi:hypothetical protein
VLTDGARREREMKVLLDKERLRGEWFRPVELLNNYLVEARRANAVVKKVALDDRLFEQYVRPAIEQHLNGRQPNLTYAGDFIFRVLHRGPEVLEGRWTSLIPAIPVGLTPEVIAGFVPLAVGEPTPAIRLSTEAARPAPEQALAS